jgi:phytoene dehydrogenase-like protein
MTTAIVVGSGPNGLAAAVTLAQHGVGVTVLEAADTIGGGMRTSENTIPGLLHDDCAAVVPIALASPFFRSLGLESHGLEWGWPTVDLAHPIDGGRAGVMVRSIEETERLLGVDGARWRSVFGPLAEGFDELIGDLLRPLVHLPQHPLRLAGFGPAVMVPATVFGRMWRSAEAKALFAGNAAHGWYPLSRPTSAVPAFMFAAAGHRYGWPVVIGGTARISDVLARVLTGLGAKIETGRCVQSLSDLPAADVVMLDLSPGAVADIAGDALRSRVRRAYRRFRFGPAAFKIASLSRAVCRGRTSTAGRRAPCTCAESSTRWLPPKARPTRGRCPSVHSLLWRNSIWPTQAARSATFTPCMRTHMCRVGTPATPPTRY